MKTEKQKMLSGENYNPGDSELLARWHKAKELTHLYNNTPLSDKECSDALLAELLGSKGKNVWLCPPFHCDYGENIHIGDHTEINMNCVFLDCHHIRIGSHVLIGPSVQIYAVGHPVLASERLPESSPGASFPFCASVTAPVTIGDHSWIGGGSILLPGVTIGKNTTIGAGSVVTKSIPDNVLAAGNPCRVLRELV